MFKNAQIKSKTEAARRLIAGEVFYYRGLRIFFDPRQGSSPFRYGNVSLGNAWDHTIEWQINVEWYEEDLSEGVLCYVWDNDGFEKRLRLINAYNEGFEYPFFSDGVGWKHAEPVTPEQATKYIKG